MRKERSATIRRYQLQLFQPGRGGWQTVVTATSAEELETSARLLGWQTGKPLRIVDPEGRVVSVGEAPEAAAPSGPEAH